MLEQILNEIRAGGTLEATSLANKLGTSPQLMTAMLEHLQRAGYISNFAKCNDGCNGCSLSKECRTSEQDLLRLWQCNTEN